MVLYIYAVYDKLSGCHKALGTDRADARAVRTFLEQVNSPQSKIDLSEFEFHKLGSYDDVTGVITPIVPYEVLPLSYPKEE